MRRIGEVDAARRELAITQTLLEELADDFESRGDRERAFDCYAVLMRLGRRPGRSRTSPRATSTPSVCTEADYREKLVLEYYEDFLEFAASSQEWHAAALLAQDAADSCAVGLSYERHYRQRASSLWSEAARHNTAAGGPPEVSENALVAAVDAAARPWATWGVGRLYAALAELPLARPAQSATPPWRAAIAAASEGLPGQAFPEYFRRKDAYEDVWRQDLVEWELGGNPLRVLAYLVVDRVDRCSSHGRPCGRCSSASRSASPRRSGRRRRAGAALGAVRVYAMLRPLEQLARPPRPGCAPPP